MSGQVYVDQFKSDPIVLFDVRSGFAINPKANTLRIFDKAPNGEWTHQLLQASDIRRIERIALTPDEFMAVGYSGAKAIGAGIGAAMRNSIERKKAAKGTGVKLYLRSVETPTVFVSIPDDARREAAYEALNQIIEGNAPNGEMRNIPESVYKAFHRPTAEEIAQEEFKAERRERRLQALKPSWKTIVGINVVAAIAIWPTLWVYREMVFDNIGRYPRTPISEDLSIFFACWLVIAYAMQTSWKVIRA